MVDPPDPATPPPTYTRAPTLDRTDRSDDNPHNPDAQDDHVLVGTPGSTWSDNADWQNQPPDIRGSARSQHTDEAPVERAPQTARGDRPKHTEASPRGSARPAAGSSGPGPEGPGSAASRTVAGEAVTSETLVSGTAASGTVAHETVASGTVASETVASETVVRGARRRRASRRWTRRVAWVLAVPVVLLVLLVAAWAIDRAITGDNVARNTELAGVAVGGMSESQLETVAEELAAQLPDTPVAIEAGELEFDTTAGDLGIGIDVAATTESVTGAGTTAPLWQRPFEWLGSFFTPRAAPVELTIDDARMDTTIAELEGEDRVAPVEPTMVVTDGVAELVPGSDGVRTDASAVRDALPESIEDVNEPIAVQVERTVVPPAMSDEQVAPLVDQTNAIAQRSTTVSAGEQSFELKGADIVGGATIDTSGAEPRLTIPDDVVGQKIIEQQKAYKNPTGVTFAAGGGGLVPVAGHDAAVCCGEGATQMIMDALIAGEPEVQVPTRTMTAAEGVEWASGLGVKQVVSGFTTPHKCCQGRVTNIHTISDRIRGTLIAPGETFSVNDLTGKRTADKGYVAAPAIVDGKHVQDVGGGVSQFATTMFNAAFFAGLPIPEYKMHSEYISRYPYAREATLFYPSVDLKIRNDTPYGIVIWPTYTDTSVTVALWSTPYARGEETGKSKTSGCGSVTTTRTITYPDRKTDTDTFRANYRCV